LQWELILSAKRFGSKMTESLNSSDDWQELLAGYILGNLSPEELIRFNLYLEKHPEARVELERLQRTLTLLPLALSEGKAPNNLKARIRSSARDTQEALVMLESATEPVLPPNSDRKRERFAAWNKIVTTIGIVAIAILGYQTYRLQKEVTIAEHQLAQLRQAVAEGETIKANFFRYQETVSLLYQSNNRLLSLTGSASSVQGTPSCKGVACLDFVKASGSLIIVPQQKIAVLVLQSVPKPPQNKLYQMWAVVNGRKVSCIKFRPDRDGRVFLQIPANNWVGTPMVVITLEPEGVTPQPQGDMVITSPQIL
jgi:anti-sigma-K factor RskA